MRNTTRQVRRSTGGGDASPADVGRMSALSQAPRSMRESCSWEGNTYAKYIFNPHRSWRDGSGSPTGTRIVDKAYAAKRLLDSIYGIRNFLWYAINQ